MIKRTVFLHDDHYVADFANSIVIACVLAIRESNTKRNQDRCRSQPIRLMASLRESAHARPKRRELSAASRGRTMVDSTHCSQCNGPLIEVDFYGERMIGCIEVQSMDPRRVDLYRLT